MPWGSRIHYKFIVDGVWTIVDGQPTEYDHEGNLNNVFDSPAPPPTPRDSESSVPAPEPTVIEPTQPTEPANGVLATIKEAAVAVVEVIAPGTAQTSAANVSEPVSQVEEIVEVVDVEESGDSAPEEIVEEITAEVVLPVSTEGIPAAPIVPVPVLPLSTGDEEKQLETTIVEGSMTGQPEPIMEPSTHTPMDAPTVDGNTEKTLMDAVVDDSTQLALAVEPSMHTPAPASETPVSNGTSIEPSTHTPAVVLTNGKDEAKLEAAPLPSSPSADVPVPTTPAANGKTTPPLAESSTTTPQTTPRKEKKHAFPTFGRHSRRSSSSVSVSTHGTDEHGVLDSPGSRNGTYKKKRTSSFFGRIKEIFTDHEHHQNGHKK